MTERDAHTGKERTATKTKEKAVRHTICHMTTIHSTAPLTGLRFCKYCYANIY